MGIVHNMDLLCAAIIEGKHIVAEEQTKRLLEVGAEPKDILDRGLMTAMNTVGVRFKEGRIFVPQVLVSARAMKTAMNLLEPLLASSLHKARGKVMLGTVKGDIHDIGKNLVGIMLRGAGYDVIDIGTGCNAEDFVSLHELHKPDVVGISALLTTTMMYMKTIVEEFVAKGISTPIIIGGAPVTSRFADEIGAAAYARNASDAVELVGSLIRPSTDFP
ncbi:MAG: corrinoid protein [Bacteroidota bacterium]